jgi:transposase-like protein
VIAVQKNGSKRFLALRLKKKWRGEYEQWKSTTIEEKDWAYLWADGIYVKAG